MSFRVEGLACGYHGKTVVQPLSFNLEPGQSLALLGPNGSGKSTLLKTLVGLLPPVEGTVSLTSPRHVAFVPQEEVVAFPFTVRQIVTMGRLPHSPGFSDTAEDKATAEEAMSRADCLAYADRPITELSGGEKQRAYIARALAQLSGAEPRVLLLDEPSTHLDFKHQGMLVRLIREVRAEGMIVIAAWHDLFLSASSCDEALLLVGGNTQYQGPTDALMNPDRLREAFDTEFDLSAGPRIKV